MIVVSRLDKFNNSTSVLNGVNLGDLKRWHFKIVSNVQWKETLKASSNPVRHMLVTVATLKIELVFISNDGIVLALRGNPSVSRATVSKQIDPSELLAATDGSYAN